MAINRAIARSRLNATCKAAAALRLPFGTDVTAFALYAYNFPYDFCFRYRRVGRRQRVPSCNQMIICDAHYAVHCELLLLSE